MTQVNDPWRVPRFQKLAASLEIELSVDQCNQLRQYLSCLAKWNKAYNLTAIKDPEKMFTHHIADSLSIAKYVTGQIILDMGTGAGLPGIPLAVLYPEKQFTLLDSVGKKVRFLHEVLRCLGLNNVTLVHSRVEDFSRGALFDIIVARAVASAADIIQQSQHILAKNGFYLLQKGAVPTHELGVLDLPYQSHVVDVPGLAAERHVILIGRE
jgi:16S rRNA (guanine527-N7)-methyltransferase